MPILAIDASTYTGTLAIVRPGQIIAAASTTMRGANEERLMPAVAALLNDHGLTVDDLEAVGCGGGPGSFTSLRIAASIAKGIAVARRIPLHVCASPLLIVAGADPALPVGPYLATLNAMRGDVFSQRVSVGADGALRVEGDAILESRASAESRGVALRATLVGPDWPGAHAPHARGFATLLHQSLTSDADVATWEPDYGRKAEAQVRWEQTHGRALTS